VKQKDIQVLALPGRLEELMFLLTLSLGGRST
jgi:hypothetical protein